MSSNIKKWENECAKQGKVLVHGYQVDPMCVPKPRQNLTQKDRDRIKGMTESQCNKNDNIATWRKTSYISHYCATPQKMPKVHGRMMANWNDLVAKSAESVCLQDVDGNKRVRLSNKQKKYCRTAANYIRQSGLGRGYVSEMNRITAQVMRGDLTSAKAEAKFDRFLKDKNRLRGLPKFNKGEQSWTTIYGLMEEQRKMKDATRKGKSFTPLKITQVRSKYGKMKDEIMKEIRSELK